MSTDENEVKSTAIITAAVIVVVLTITTGMATCEQRYLDTLKECIKAGHTPAECATAIKRAS